MNQPARGAREADTPWKLGRGHDNNFDFLRCFFALLVIYCHSFVLDRGKGAVDGIAILTHGQADGGSIAVDAFFAISGLLITQSWLGNETLMVFLRKRVLRMYPGFLLASLLCVILVGPLSRPDDMLYLSRIDPRVLLRSAALLFFDLPELFPHNPFPHSVDGSLWTIPYEFGCYLFVAAMGVTRLLRRPAAVVVLFVIAYAAHECAPDENWPRFLCYFLAGASFCVCRSRIPRSAPVLWLSLLAIVSLGLWGRGLEFVFPLCGTYALFYAAFRPVARLTKFGRYGDFSYGLYLYAFPVQQLLVLYAGDHLTSITLFLAASLLTLPLAALSWFFVEKPALALKLPFGSAEPRSAQAFVAALLRHPLLGITAALALLGMTDHYFVYPLGRLAAKYLASPRLQATITVTLFAVFLPWCALAALRAQETGRDLRTIAARWRPNLIWLVAVAPIYAVLAVCGAKTLLSIGRAIAGALLHGQHV